MKDRGKIRCVLLVKDGLYYRLLRDDHRDLAHFSDGVWFPHQFTCHHLSGVIRAERTLSLEELVALRLRGVI